MNRSKDRVFKDLQVPLLFAHRGGAREAPESTERAFKYALTTAKADVLELDVHVTHGDEHFIVWHGPDLNNVLIEGQPTDIRKRDPLKSNITQFSWAELHDKAWIERRDSIQYDVSGIQRSEDNKILLLEQFLQLFPTAHLNIEMKDESFRLNHVEAFSQMLSRYREKRTILVVSQSHSLLKRFRDVSQEDFPTGLSMREVLMSTALGILPGIGPRDLDNRALQSTYSEHLTTRSVVNDVHSAGGAVHVFLTRFGFVAPGIDEQPGTPRQEEISALLDRGVDGIMTDRPGAVRPLIDAWLHLHQ